MRKLFRIAGVLLCVGLAAVGSGLPGYRPQSGLEGTIVMKGSDSIDPLLRLWICEFRRLQPGVHFTVESKGSGTAPAGLLEGEADLGHMSRAMTASEEEAFQGQFGHGPTGLVVAYDALAIFVNRRNPVKQIRLDQLEGIYASAPSRPVTRWGGLEMRPRTRQRFKRAAIHPYTRDEKSGSRAFFQEKVMQKGAAFRSDVRVADQVGILDAIGKDLRAIGYGPESYRSPLVRMVPLAPKGGGRYVLPTPANIQSHVYPLARSLYLYVNRPPERTLPPPVQAFLAFVLSAEGQALVQDYGCVPLRPEAAAAESAKLD